MRFALCLAVTSTPLCFRCSILFECWCVDFLVCVGAIGASLERARRVTGTLIESVTSLSCSSSCSSTYYGMLRDTILYDIRYTTLCDAMRCDTLVIYPSFTTKCHVYVYARIYSFLNVLEILLLHAVERLSFACSLLK